MTLLEEFKNFLHAFHNSEAMSPELRSAVTVPTSLPELLKEAVQVRPFVVLTGAQGTGKTHVLDTFRRDLGKEIECVEFPKQTSTRNHIRIVSDATPLSDTARKDALKRSRGCKGVIVAINEGPLRDMSRKKTGSSGYKKAYDFLQKGRLGLDVPLEPSGPTVIDMAAYDPIQEGQIAKLLDLPILSKLVEESKCQCAKDVCIRRQAWKQLKGDEARTRVAEVVKLSLLDRREWTYRQLWDLVADMAVGGSCADEDGQTAWFYRLFYGESALSKALARVVKPQTHALVRTDQYLCFGNHRDPSLKLVGRPPAKLARVSNPDRPERLQWYRLQILLLGKTQQLNARVQVRGSDSLVSATRQYDVNKIIQGINRYMYYGIEVGNTLDLDLWVSHQVQRRDQGSEKLRKDKEGQVCLGRATSRDFEITTSRVVINPADGGSEKGPTGTNFYLMHKPSQVSLELSLKTLALIEKGRARRQSDREQADLVGHLMKFFDALLALNAFSGAKFEVLDIDIANLKTETTCYRVSRQPALVEEQ